MRILHVVSGMQKASGVTTFVENVVEELRALGHEVDVLTKSGAECHNRRACEGRAAGEGIAEAQPRAETPRANFSAYDIVHVHGLWDPWLHEISRCTMHEARGAKLVWSPHGMLQKWALKNKWWKKLAGLALYQWWDLRRADLLHVTADSEVADVRRLALPNPLVLAPLGVKTGDIHSTPTPSTYTSEQKHTLLFVSRVQRKKGLPNLITAWSRLPEDLRTAWTIRIVGPDQDNHTAELKAQAQALGVAGDFEFVGPKYDAELDAEYDAADLFVLPTHSENFGSVVIEALAHEVPVICTKAAPWAELEGDSSGNGRCGWWIDDNVDALTTCLRTALNTPPSTLAEMGARGRSLVKSKYTWRAVASRLSTAYAEIVGCR